MRQGDRIVVTPLRLGRRGEAEAEHEDRRVRVRNGIPGEAARVVVTHVSKGGPVAETRFEAPAGEPHPGRRPAPCPIHDTCGGCGLQHVMEGSALRLKVAQAQALLPAAEWLEPIRAPRSFGYRAKTFLLPQKRKGRLMLGARPARGPKLVDTSGCGVLLPHLEACCARIRDRFRDRPELARGWRSILLRANRAGKTQGCVVHGSDTPPEPLPAAATFAQVHDEETNVVFSDAEERLLQGTQITERFAGLDFAIPPTAFWQGNPDVAEQLYERAADALDGERLGELYCGAGAAGLLALARRPGATLLGVDRSPRAVAVARANAERHGLEARFEAKGAADVEATWDAVLVNPPRSGCHAAVLDAVRRSGAGRLVYLSCNPQTLARDAEALGWTLRSVTPADMLPQTPHLELLAVLDR